VKRSDVTPQNAEDIVLAVKSTTGAACYSFTYVLTDVTSGIPEPVAVTVSNGSDAGVATMGISGIGDGGVTLWTVTCSGGQPVALDPSCANDWPAAWLSGPPVCTGSGTCAN
jgi:hypothetical protein